MSGGQPSSAGNYTLILTASPRSIPADMVKPYAVTSFTLVDSSGGSAENFVITFNSELGYLENDPDGSCNLEYDGRAGAGQTQMEVRLCIFLWRSQGE